MAPGYIYRRQDVRPLLHGLMVHVSCWWAESVRTHGHRCTACEHRVACTCATRGKLNLVRCAWCTPWVMEWRRSKRKPTRRRTTRRLTPAVP